MSGIDGVETARAVRAAHPNVAIVLASGYAEGRILEQVEEGEIDRIIAKPFKSHVLIESLRAAIEERALR